MIIILYSQFEEFESHKFNFYLHKLPVELREKIASFKKWEDKQASLIGKLLLLEGLRYFGKSESLLQEMKYTAYNRPYINNEIDFNISHSGNITVCAIGEEVKLGIDIEKEQPRNFKQFKTQFSEEEWKVIEQSDNHYTAFYKLWTKKEAIIKAHGKRLQLPSTKILLDNEKGCLESECWFLTEVDIMPGYETCLATNIEAEIITIMQVAI